MSRDGGTHGDGADDDLEIIDLEPAVERSGLPGTGSRATDTRLRRAPVLIAIVVVVALVASVVISQSHESKRSREGASTSTLRPRQLHTEFPGALLFPSRVGAAVLTGGANGLQVTDTDTGRVTYPRVRGLPDGSVTIVAHSGGTVAVRIDGHVSWFTMHDLVAHAVDATTAFPAVQNGFLWVAGRGSATMVPRPNKPVATWGSAVGATRAGLVVTDAGGVSLQPAGAEPKLLLPAPVTVLGVHPDRIAWVSNECGVLRCPVHVIEIATGATSSWLQLTGRPTPLMTAGSSAMFSPDGDYLAIVVPDKSVTTAENLVVADLRTRAATTLYVRGGLDQPARPGSDDATGLTIDWTADGRYLLLAASEKGRVVAVDPARPKIVSSPVSWGITTSAAVIGASSAGPLDYPRHNQNLPVDSGGPTQFGSPGLSLAAADDSNVDLVDLTSSRVTSWVVEGRSVSESGPNPMAKVTDGWLVVRYQGNDPIVDLFPTAGGKERSLGSGSRVFASADGSYAWISDPSRSQVQSYDARTEILGIPFVVLGQPVAEVGDRLVTAISGEHNVRLDTVDPAGFVRTGPSIDVAPDEFDVLAAAGTLIVFSDVRGLHLLDVVSGAMRVLATGASDAAFSPDGTALAWIDRATRGVVAMPVAGIHSFLLGGPADRVLVANDGTVVFMNGVDVRRGRVDQIGSSPVFGFAPDRQAVLGLG